MRIPWYIYAPLSLLVTIGTLYLCIRDKDNVTPPSAEATAESIRIWRENNPSIKNTQLSDNPPTPPKPQTKPEPKTEPEPEKPTPIPAPKLNPRSTPSPVIAIPETSPSLSSLAQLNLTTQQLTTYAEIMLKNSKPQLARIAYERIIDSAKDSTENDRQAAASSIAKLLNKTPLWNPDPSIRKKLTINLTLSSPHTENSKELITQLQTLIFDSSDGTINPTIKLTSSNDDYSSLDLGNGTPIVKFKPANKTTLIAQIHTALYYSISTKNNQSQKLTSIPPIPTHISPKQALQTYITRLAWVNAAN